MKKLVIASIALFLVATSSINAQTAPAPTTPETAVVADTAKPVKTPLKVEELPEVIKTAIAADDYKGWEVKSASVIKAETEIYEIIFVKGEETTIVSFDKEGKKIV